MASRSPKKARRTQEERTAAMRERLLNATVECLYELGYARTTTTAVVERAGVSRGAQLHHFPTKADLVATAVEYVMERRNEEFLQVFSGLDPDDDLAGQVVDALWRIFSGPTFYAWLELLVAARTDPDLAEKVNAIAERFQASVDQSFRAIFQIPADEYQEIAIAPRFTFLLLEGMALERIRKQSPKMEGRMLKALKALAPEGIAATRR
jgi:AcrR family transcriptional regulator